MHEGGVVLRSYRLAFELERRIHRIDRYRIPLPYGLPLSAAGVGLASAIVVVALTSLPGVGAVIGMLPLPMRLLFVPGAAAHLLCRKQSDGRRVYEALAARLLFAVRPRRLVSLERRPCQRPLNFGLVTIAPDERAGALRAATVRGPAELIVRRQARATIRARRLELEPASGDVLPAPVTVRLRAAERLVVR